MVYNSVYRHRWKILKRLCTKLVFRWLGPLHAIWQPEARFHIKKGYHHAATAEAYNAVPTAEEWQREVYELAAQKLQELHGTTVIDIGCGSGFKLLKNFPASHTIGIELDPTYTWLQEQYPGRNWLRFGDFDPATLNADLVICADVIEHLADPDELMRFIQQVNFRLLILSTPERDAVAGFRDFGPPENTCHFREWNAGEFNAYASGFLNVEAQVIFPGKSTTQVLICSHKTQDT